LLEQLRGEVFALVTDNDALLARFAAAINAFDAEGHSSWWLRLRVAEPRPDALDLKKAGTFPLVHGVRALALNERLDGASTVERIDALVAAHRLPAALGAELIDSLHFFMRLKLGAGLAALAVGQTGSTVALDHLSGLDRELLKGKRSANPPLRGRRRRAEAWPPMRTLARQRWARWWRAGQSTSAAAAGAGRRFSASAAARTRP